MAVSVLVVDDDPLVRTTAVMLFRGLGATTYDASRGEDALRILEAHPEIDLLFSDVVMPGMNGPSLGRAARAMRPQLRVVLATGYAGQVPTGDFLTILKPYREADISRLL